MSSAKLEKQLEQSCTGKSEKNSGWIGVRSSPADNQTEWPPEGAPCLAHRGRRRSWSGWTPRTGSAWPADEPIWSRRAVSSTSGWPPQSPVRCCLPQCLHSLRMNKQWCHILFRHKQLQLHLKHTNLCSNVDFKSRNVGGRDALRTGHYLYLPSTLIYPLLKRFSSLWLI